VSERTEGGRHRPRKRFGQHFLVDRGVVRRIVSLVDPQAGEVVLEIGPGRGALTDSLAEALPRLLAVEIDRDLAAALRSRLGEPNLRLIEADILQLDMGDILREEGGESLLLVGNLPYNITAPLLFRMLEEAGKISRAILMVQREVARRLVARSDSKEYGLITVLLAMHAEVEVRLEVGRRSFRPAPRVDSSVIEVRFSAACRRPVRDEALFGRLVRTAFGQRRKMLRNSLLGLTASGKREELEGLAERAEVELTRRPESLSLEEFARLADELALMERDCQ
jgi:16S rRNA (adenine1518-N6/adenine1519-N6)-dimethyltransferase